LAKRGRRRAFTAAAVVAGLAMLALGQLAHLVEFRRRAVAWIRLALAQQLARPFAITLETVGLEILRIGRPLVPLDTEPAQALENLVERFLGRALLIGVVDPQDEGALLVTREEIGEQSRTDVANMQRAGRTGRIACANGHRVLCSFLQNQIENLVVIARRASAHGHLAHTKQYTSSWSPTLIGTIADSVINISSVIL